MKKISLLLSAFCACCVAGASTVEFSGPDKKLVVSVSDDGGVPVYEVRYDGTVFLERSPLGVLTDINDLQQGLDLREEEVTMKTVDIDYSLASIKRSHVELQAMQAVCPFYQGDKHVMDVVFHVSANDVAFKYRLYPQKDRLCCVVKKEATGFVLPEGTTTFLCPQATPMGGFARTSPSYETSYTVDDAMGKNGWGQGYTFPCLFRVGEQGWVLISETGVDSRYCGSRLLSAGERAYAIGFPQEGEWNGNGTVCPGLMLPGETPWRTLTVGQTLAPIVESTVAWDVVEPLYERAFTPVYGRGTWSWIMGGDNSMNYDEQRRYIDFAAQMGYESVLVDAWWDSRVGYERMAELADYARQKGVGLYLWYNSNGYWNDAPQGPRGRLDRSVVRRREMAWMRDAGIRGIKVDFVGSDKQETMRLYEDILCDANEYGLLVIFHGCTLPRGWERMYPNFVSAEAVLASENMHFSQGSCDAEAFNATLHPFIRNSVGAMDFGGSTLNHYYNGTDEPRGSRRVTSDVYALATAVLFQSAVQHFALTPVNLTNAPQWAMDFMKRVPAVWDEVRFIDGYPGKYVVLARRSGDTWYVAGVNAQDETVETKVTLPMFAAGQTVSCYEDDKKLQGELKQRRVGKDGKMKISIPKNGGVVLVGE